MNEKRLHIILSKEVNENFKKERYIDIDATKKSKSVHFCFNVLEDITVSNLKRRVEQALRDRREPIDITLSDGLFELFQLVNSVLVSTKDTEKDQRVTKENRLVEPLKDRDSDEEIFCSEPEEEFTGMKDKVIVILKSLAHSGSRLSGSSRGIDIVCHSTSRIFYSEQATHLRRDQDSQLMLDQCFQNLVFMGSRTDKDLSIKSLLETITAAKIVPYFKNLAASTSAGSRIVTAESVLAK